MNTIFIKYMVCDRCIMVVQNELEKLGLDAKNIKLGEVILSKEITREISASICRIGSDKNKQ